MGTVKRDGQSGDLLPRIAKQRGYTTFFGQEFCGVRFPQYNILGQGWPDLHQFHADWDHVFDHFHCRVSEVLTATDSEFRATQACSESLSWPACDPLRYFLRAAVERDGDMWSRAETCLMWERGCRRQGPVLCLGRGG